MTSKVPQTSTERLAAVVQRQEAARSRRRAPTTVPRRFVPLLANVGRNHPDYGLTPAQHWERKRARAEAPEPVMMGKRARFG